MTLYIVRHGSAGRRNGADPGDTERHLDPKGQRQAAMVADHLCAEPVDAVLSSPLPRCVQTVEPLAAALGLEVVVEPRLAEGTDIDRAWKVIEETVEGLSGKAAVLCSHGDVIPEIIRRNESRGMRVPGVSGFAKGSVWALHGWDGSRFTKGSWNKLR